MDEKKCTGNCIACSFAQQVYCAAQHGHAIIELFPPLFERLEKVESALARFMPGSEVFNPLVAEAQKEGGAENRPSETTNTSNDGL